MATDPYWQLEKEYTTLTKITPSRSKPSMDGKTTRTWEPSKVHEYRLSRDELTAASPVFRNLLTTAIFREASEKTVELHEDPPQALVTCFKILHDVPFDTDAFKSINLKGVWEVLATAHKYDIDPRGAKAQAWFVAWWAANWATGGIDGKKFGYEQFQALLYPCWTFDYAPGWQEATKYLVYRANGHITERHPDGFYHDHLHLPQSIIQQLNAAKGRLKTVLHRELYNPIDGLLKHPDCEDAPHVLYGYEQSLSNTGAWPLETNFMRTSVWDILRELERFQILPAVRATSCGRGQCDFDMYVRAVATAVRKTKDYFDGLCLDCMNKSNPKLGDHHEDYWSHSKLTVPWDYGCRVSHTQPSWYFSFMGRRQKMTEYTKSRGRGRFHDRE